MKRIFNTDLAFENLNYKECCQNFAQDDLGYCKVIRQTIQPQKNFKAFDCATVFCDKLYLLDDYTLSLISLTISDELTRVIENIFKSANINVLSYLVVGLGNAEYTADSIGPLTTSMLYATRHLNEKSTRGNIIPSISIFTPGVLSKSGIESADMVRAVSKEISPDLIIAVDALSARSCERLGSTVQLSTAGIAPGSGVRNSKTAISEDTLGIPVVSIGVPTVVDSATLVLDILEKSGLEEIDQELFAVLKESKSFFVTPKECDEIVKESAKLISRAINTALGIIS